MKKEKKPVNSDKDTHKEGRENQNIRDFNPSQFVDEDEVIEKKDNKEKVNKEPDKKER